MSSYITKCKHRLLTSPQFCHQFDLENSTHFPLKCCGPYRSLRQFLISQFWTIFDIFLTAFFATSQSRHSQVIRRGGVDNCRQENIDFFSLKVFAFWFAGCSRSHQKVDKKYATDHISGYNSNPGLKQVKRTVTSYKFLISLWLRFDIVLTTLWWHPLQLANKNAKTVKICKIGVEAPFSKWKFGQVNFNRFL